MKVSRKVLIVLVSVVFIVLDIWNGNTYNFMKVESMVYLSGFILLIAGILLLNRNDYKKFIKLFSGMALFFAIVFVLGGLMSSRMINAKKYANVIGTIEQVEFSDLYGKDHTVEMSYVDKDSALLSAEKKIGELSDVSSMFDINNRDFSQINYKGEMVRVAPFKYSSPIKQLLNLNKGVPYYVMVQTGSGNTNAKAEIITLKQPMKYYPGAPLHYNLKRHVAFNHKFSYLGGWNFEVNDEGHPYWIVSTLTKEVGLWGAQNVKSIIVVDAVSGESKNYKIDDVPEWVDLVYPTPMLLSHAKDHYSLSKGYINSKMQQVGVKVIDQDNGTYNYVSIDDEIYVFTGIRPISLDEGSTTGLLFMSTKTGKALSLDLPGISLTTAEATSIGSIQEKNYVPTTPVLQNVGGYPTYVMSLKDQSGVIRGFSMVDYQDYTKSSVGSTIKEVEKTYLALHADSDTLLPEDSQELTITITEIKQVQIEGNTFYYLMVEESDEIYNVSLSLDDKLPFYKANDRLKVKVNGNKIIEILEED
ncbi:hypothetical protein ERUR111494_08580 [Erysipelothrix urinaevulpis]|uniref:hypothetical protein n=1 Tax=Erysipelothrix urinaevulpis TaxID=2683717 RepID=UPI00135A6093|nr:hypothetical protein [Erysipelothrix urinaevulpis]